MAAPPTEVRERSFLCQGCGATLQYLPGTPHLKCPYCGRDHAMETRSSPIREHVLEELSLVPHTSIQGFGIGVRQFKCDRCGALTSLPGATVATRCAFCGSDVVVETPPVPGMVRPESLVPFQIDKPQATTQFQGWLRGLWFRPGNLKTMAGLAQIDGLYIPHFTFDAQARSQWSGEAGHYYYVTENYTSGGQRHTRQVQKIRWEHRSGAHEFFYDDELICASRGLPEEILSKIYPFDLRGLVPYTPEYLSGFGAEAYTVDPREAWGQARASMHTKETAACSRLLGGDTQRGLRVHAEFLDPRWKHLLLPAYVASYVYGAKTYRFMVNGQTGEVQGEAPISWGKVALAVGGIVLVVIGLLKLTNAI